MKRKMNQFAAVVLLAAMSVCHIATAQVRSSPAAPATVTSSPSAATGSQSDADALARLRSHELGGAHKEAKGSHRAVPASSPKTATSPPISAGAPGDSIFRPQPSVYDSAHITYDYDTGYTYPVHATVGQPTYVVLSDDEQVRGVYGNGTKLWVITVSKVTPEVMIEPKEPGLVNEMEIVTTKRRYWLKVDSNGLGYFMSVQWNYSSGELAPGEQGHASPFGVEFGNANDDRNDSAPRSTQGASGSADNSPMHVDIANSNFDYRIEGDAPFKPDMVFDNGKFTWIKMPPGVQEHPAFFEINSDGVAVITNFLPGEGSQHDYYVGQRLYPYGILLKLGKQEVKIYNTRTAHCGFLNFSCRNKQVRNFAGQ